MELSCALVPTQFHLMSDKTGVFKLYNHNIIANSLPDD